jgi:Holliday junction resolvase
VKDEGRAKERRVHEILLAHGLQIESYDRVVANGCSKRRPDFILDYGTFKVVLEVDERAHATYDCGCEQRRMLAIYQDFGGSDVVFVRYNPDSYRDKTGEIHPPDTKRERILLDLLRSLANTEIRNCHLTVYYLFYNEWNGTPVRYDVDPDHAILLSHTDN